MKTVKIQAIYNLYPQVSYTRDNKCFDRNDIEVIIDDNKLSDEISRLQSIYDDKQYQRERAKTYPSISDQLDMLYWDKVNGTNNWQTEIQAVKTKYPKS